MSATAARTEPALADALLETLDQYAIADNLAGAQPLLNVVPQQIAFIDRLLDGSRGRTRTRLLYVAARFAEFAGWLNQDAGDLHAAMRWSNNALDLAVEAGDPHLVSYVRMRKSNIASDAGNPNLALAFARAALQNPHELTPRLLAVARRQQANAHVLNGNADECARALDLAFQHAADAPHDPTDVARYCTPSWVEMEAAHCWVALGKPTKAITTLQQSLADWRPDFRRDLGVCLTRLAVAHASAEQPEYALAVAEHALPIAVDTGSHRAARELRRLPGLLAAAGADEHAARTRQALTALR